MSSETISPRPDFDRRRKPDETFDSICLRCCKTIATNSSETGLTQLENLHWCWQRQEKLMRLTRMTG